MAQDPPDRPSRGSAWADLAPRLASALVLAPVALLCVIAGKGFWAALLVLAALGLATEWVRLCGRRADAMPGLMVPVAVLVAAAVAAARHVITGLGVLALGTAVTWLIARRSDKPVFLAAGTLYVGVSALALIWLRHDDGAGLANVLFLVLVVWASDIGAYASGRLLGGPKLAPRISPSKTWAGSAGGLVAAIVVGLAMARLLGNGPVAGAAIVSAVLGLVAQAGDLLESWLKRRVGVKDSGRLIPGHGGLLDRLDGILAAAPVAALLAAVLGRGVLIWQ